MQAEREVVRRQEQRDQAAGIPHQAVVRGQQLGKGRPVTQPEGGRQDHQGPLGRLHGSLELGDQHGAGPEIPQGQDRPWGQADLGQQEPVHPLGVALGIRHEQFRLRRCVGAGISGCRIHRTPRIAGAGG